jgi:ribosomal protein S18 acetylase RimI-like enzyme
VVHYRHFRNDDPPGLVDIWNAAFTGRGAVIMRHSSPLERGAFSKPYFDPAGLIVALEDGNRVGFAHAGFGANETESAISNRVGVTCAIGVIPSHQRRGIGTELLRRAEDYLRGQGAKSICAGAVHPLNPFYFGLYGGSEQPGFLDSDGATARFLEARGYRGGNTALVFQRHLDKPLNVADGRFPGLRRRFRLEAAPWVRAGTWWKECVLGSVEPIEFRMQDAATGQAVARAKIWEMEGFSWRWGLPSVGLLDLFVEENVRRQGLGKLLLLSIMQYLQDQYFGLIEAQTLAGNLATLGLYRCLGFEQVDAGRVYRKDESPAPASASERNVLPNGLPT